MVVSPRLRGMGIWVLVTTLMVLSFVATTAYLNDLGGGVNHQASAKHSVRSSLYDIALARIDGSQTSMQEYKGKTLLIVNTASNCGFTPQYGGLNELYKKYRDRGFVVLGFPCNQFGGQEPSNEQEIKHFCAANYQIEFPMFAKIDVNGEHTHPLYRILKNAAPGVLGTMDIKWNFTKFLVDRKGNVLKRYASKDTPESLVDDIEAALEVK